MRFLIFNRHLSEQQSTVDYNCVVPYLWISITDSDEESAKLATNDMCHGTLFLKFDDIEKPYPNMTAKLMSDDQAKDIVEFVSKNKDEIYLICVNCEAGISRSSGTALALSLLMNGHDHDIRADPRYYPNHHVKDLVIKHGEPLKNDKTPRLFESVWNEDLADKGSE